MPSLLHHPAHYCCFKQGLEQVSDAAEWLQQLGDSAQILSPDAMRDIMLEWLDKQEALEKIGSDAAEATAEAGMDAEAEAGTETDAEADTEGAAAADVQAKGASHAPQMSHASSPEPHGSGVPAAASTSRQPKGEGCSNT